MWVRRTDGLALMDFSVIEGAHGRSAIGDVWPFVEQWEVGWDISSTWESCARTHGFSVIVLL